MRRRAFLFLTAMAAALLTMAGPAWAETFVVNSTGDGADQSPNGSCDTGVRIPDPAGGFGLVPECTLRASLQENNANDNGAAVVDAIDFGIAGSGVRTISPTGALPELAEPVTIDGYTQPGASENTKPVGTNAVLRVELDGTSVSAGSGLDISASNSAIRGLVINRFGGHGILIDRCITDGHRIEGNFIGTDPGGTQNLGNDGNGVVADCSGSTTVGGTSPAARNLISGNGVSGVNIGGPGSTVQGNLIGTTKEGTTALGNRYHGVKIVGPSSTVAGNTIAFNILGAGVQVVEIGEGTRANSILSNSIFSNGRLGIDLDGNGVTANDAGDADTGTNNLQNFPTVTRATTSRSTGRSVVRGTLNSTPTTAFTIQLFVNSAQDPSGFGEGQRLLRTLSVRTDASGNASFGLKARKLRGFISATATNDPTGDTSEFSKAKKVIRTR